MYSCNAVLKPGQDFIETLYVLSPWLQLTSNLRRSETIQQRSSDKYVGAADTFEHELKQPQPQLVLDVPKVYENWRNSKLYLMGVNQAPIQRSALRLFGADRVTDCR